MSNKQIQESMNVIRKSKNLHLSTLRFIKTRFNHKGLHKLIENKIAKREYSSGEYSNNNTYNAILPIFNALPIADRQYIMDRPYFSRYRSTLSLEEEEKAEEARKARKAEESELENILKKKANAIVKFQLRAKDLGWSDKNIEIQVKNIESLPTSQINTKTTQLGHPPNNKAIEAALIHTPNRNVFPDMRNDPVVTNISSHFQQHLVKEEEEANKAKEAKESLKSILLIAGTLIIGIVMTVLAFTTPLFKIGFRDMTETEINPVSVMTIILFILVVLILFK